MRTEAIALEVTSVGWIILVLLLLLAVKRRNALPSCWAFLTPWSGTAVANIYGIGDLPRHVQPWLAAAAAVICTSAIALLLGRSRETRATLALTLVSALMILWSLMVMLSASSAVLRTESVVTDVDPGCACATAVTRQTQIARTLTQATYVVLGAAIVVLAPSWQSDGVTVRGLLRSYIAGTNVMAVLGLAQLGAQLAGKEIVLTVFNNSANPFAQGWQQSMGIGALTRLSVGASEPSLFAQALLIALAIVVAGPRAVASRSGRVGVAMLLAAALVASSSTTAFVGLGALSLFWSARLLMVGRTAGWGSRELALVGAALFGAVAVGGGLLQELIRQSVLEKMESDSFQDRLMSIELGLAAFVERPWLGWGPGVLTARSLPIWLLANTGLAGVASFVALLAGTFGALAPHGGGSQERSAVRGTRHAFDN